MIISGFYLNKNGDQRPLPPHCDRLVLFANWRSLCDHDFAIFQILNFDLKIHFISAPSLCSDIIIYLNPIRRSEVGPRFHVITRLVVVSSSRHFSVKTGRIRLICKI